MWLISSVSKVEIKKEKNYLKEKLQETKNSHEIGKEDQEREC